MIHKLITIFYQHLWKRSILDRSFENTKRCPASGVCECDTEWHWIVILCKLIRFYTPQLLVVPISITLSHDASEEGWGQRVEEGRDHVHSKSVCGGAGEPSVRSKFSEADCSVLTAPCRPSWRCWSRGLSPLPSTSHWSPPWRPQRPSRWLSDSRYPPQCDTEACPLSQ